MLQCHKEEHFKKDCLEKKNKSKDQKNQSGDDVVAEKEEYKSTYVLIMSDVKQEDKWVLDSGCSFHMCPLKNILLIIKNLMEVE